jgi:hypothetical protein
MIISRRMRWAGKAAHTEKKTNEYMALVGRPSGKRPLGRPRHRSKDNIAMDRLGWYGLD